MNQKAARVVASMSILGTAAAFVGHGVLAATRDPLWVGLFRDSLATMGINVSQVAVSDMTQMIGVADIVFGLALVVIGSGLFGNSMMRRVVMSRAVLYVLGVAAFWQVATAAVVMVAEASFVPGVWHFLADSPKFLLPILAIVSLQLLRRLK